MTRQSASPAVNDERVASLLDGLDVLLLHHTLFSPRHYAFYYYKQQEMPSQFVKPDILYSTEGEGEILIEWDSEAEELSMRIFVDISNLKESRHNFIRDLVSRLERVSHPNIMKITEPAKFINEIKTLVFKTEAPDHITTWNQFCKHDFSPEEVMSVFRQLCSAIAHLHDNGIIHRDVHPTRVHYNNGLVKLNLIGHPRNFKRLLKNKNVSGHVDNSAPEIIFVDSSDDDVDENN